MPISEQREDALAVVQVSLGRVASVALQSGLALLLGTAAIGTVVLVGGGGSPLLAAQGFAIVVASVVLIARVDVAASLLRPRGAMWLVVALFCALGAVEHALQPSFSNVLLALVWIAAVVSSIPSVIVTVLIAWAGYTVDLVLEPGAVRAANGSLLSQGVGELVILIISAGLTAAAVTILRHTLADAPARLANARSGAVDGRGLPELAAAVRRESRALLERGDSAAIIAGLSGRERAVVELLVRGLTPKQIAGRSFVTMATVRSQIASAKRKTGARTLDQLVGLYAEGTRDG